MQIFSLKSCDTCRKAIRELRAAGHHVAVIDIREPGVTPQDLVRFYRALGDNLVNRRSTTWRALSASERAQPPLELLANHPTLMKRPVIDANGQLFLGWGPDVRNALLGSAHGNA